MTATLTPGSADALLFDLGRVVIDIDLRAHAESVGGRCRRRSAGDDGARLARNDTFHRYETGHVDDAEFFAAVRDELGVDLPTTQLLDGWNAIFIGEMPGIAPLLAARRAAAAAVRAVQHQRRAYRAFLAALRRAARPFPRTVPVVADRDAQAGRARPTISWSGRSASRPSALCSSTIWPRTSKPRAGAGCKPCRSTVPPTSRARWTN